MSPRPAEGASLPVAKPPSPASTSTFSYPSHLFLEVPEKGPSKSSRDHKLLLATLDTYGGVMGGVMEQKEGKPHGQSGRGGGGSYA